MLALHKIIRLAIFVSLANLIWSEISLAGPPTGPNKNDCKNALTAIKIQDINFGEFLGGIGGTITIATNGSRTSGGGVVLMGGSTTAAIFEVYSSLPGCEVYPVTIKTPNNSTLTEPIGNTMLANNFVTLPASGFTIIPGIPTLVQVGADLTVNATQAGGTYVTLAPYTLTFR